MNAKTLLSLLLLTLVSFLVVNKAKCEEQASVDSATDESKFLTSMNDSDLAQAMSDLLIRTRSYASPLEIDLNSVKFINQTPGQGPNFNAEKNVIRCSVTLGPEVDLPLLVHEYTHAIFEAFMRKNSSHWRDFLENRELAYVLSRKYSDLAFDLQFKVHGTQEDRVQLEKYRALAKKKQAEFELLQKVEKLRTAYTELAADSLTVLLSDDLNIIRTAVKAIPITLSENLKLSMEWRSFDLRFGLPEMSIWVQQVERIRSLVGFFDPYDLFAPARSAIGQIIKTKTSEASKHMFFLRLLDVLKDDHEKRITTVNADSSSLDPIELNRNVIENLQKSLKEQ